MSAEAIAAIRSVRVAAHDLANACSAIVGGTEMAISLPTVDTLGKSTRGLRKKSSNRPVGGES